MCDLSKLIGEVNEHPHKQYSFYEFPELYHFFYTRARDQWAKAEYLRKHQPSESTELLILGCGTGVLFDEVNDDYDRIVGVDIDDGMIQFARERAGDVKLVQADITDCSGVTYGRPFDLVVMFNTFLHIPTAKVKTLAENVFEHLRGGGVFLGGFFPFTDSSTNGRKSTDTVESNEYHVDRHVTSALTSPDGESTAVYLYLITDMQDERSAQFGTILTEQSHDPTLLKKTFSDTGFDSVEVNEPGGKAFLHAVR